ncbi:MAG: hypothetical protein AB7N91_30385 [Candidatus Tectimicrobiota bacterium]
MLKAQLTVDLPSVETLRRLGPLEWLQSLFGKTFDLRSGAEELTMSAFALLQGLYRAMRQAGVTDAVSLLVDKKVIYADREETDDDLDLVLQAAESAGLFLKRFTEMHLALAHRDQGLHTLVDVKVHSHVLRGEDEMVLTLSGHVEALRIKTGESAAAYAERVRTFGDHPETLEAYRLLLEALQTRLSDALRHAMPEAVVHATPAEIVLIWPGDREIGRLRRLPFGAEVDEPRYRPIPARQQYGAYNDPYYLYYYDPYADLMHWLLLDTLLRQTSWPSPAMHVMHSDGTAVTVAQQHSSATAAWDTAAIQFDEAGTLQVAETIPDDWGGVEISPSAPAWDDASAATRLWGGSDLNDGAAADSGWGGSDVSDAGSSCGSSSCGSSCGSSCSSSSC